MSRRRAVDLYPAGRFGHRTGTQFRPSYPTVQVEERYATYAINIRREESDDIPGHVFCPVCQSYLSVIVLSVRRTLVRRRIYWLVILAAIVIGFGLIVGGIMTVNDEAAPLAYGVGAFVSVPFVGLCARAAYLRLFLGLKFGNVDHYNDHWFFRARR